ncbi:MAG: glycosyltransferase family 2 protein [Thermodesulfovibrionales bacterium]
MTRISVCCPTFNAERTLEKTLQSVRAVADEIVIVDSFSTDRTLEIARRFTDRVVQHPYSFHGIQMNYAIGLCSNDWVFCIDADEAIDAEMAAHIRRIKEEQLGTVDPKTAFRLRREWYFLGGRVHAFYPVTAPDRIIRFFNRTAVRFNERPVHDKPVGHDRCLWLEGRLIHDTTGSLHELFDKMNKYTTRHAHGFADQAGGVSPLNFVFNPAGAFVKWYFLKKNVLDGFRGFVLGAYAGLYTFLKYVKLYEKKGR